MLDNAKFAENPHPIGLCVLLLDTSGSMDGTPISALNEGLKVFQQDIQTDAMAKYSIQLAIVTFGSEGVQIKQEFVKASEFKAPLLSAGGSTPMGEAINKALDMLRTRKDQIDKQGVQRYRPWVFLITDGAPTDQWQAAAERVHREEQANRVAFFAVGVGEADMSVLSKIAVREPVKLQGLKFTELFLWLSASQKRVSNSKVGDPVPLPSPQGWAAV